MAKDQDVANIRHRGAGEPAVPFLSIRGLDIVFISYDEPQADANWADLLEKRPDARRVHGVRGLDHAHKAAAEAAGSEYFVTVDGDTVVDPAFFDLVLDARHLSSRRLITWPSRNSVNGLVYGNGSLKCWHRHGVLAMRTHEEAPAGSAAAVDFGRLFERVIGAGCFSETRINGSAEQAFRTAFREGVKLSLVEGRPAGPALNRDISPAVRHRLQLWCSVGADIQHGVWSMYGARLGCVRANLEAWDLQRINDYDQLGRLWSEAAAAAADDWSSLSVRVRDLGDRIRQELGLNIEELTPRQSRFFKETYMDQAATPAVAVDVPHAATCGAALDKLGTLYRRGQGVPKDPEEAARLYALADKFECRNGTKNLALLYRRGTGVTRDHGHAVSLLRKADAAGSPDAPFHLAKMLREETELRPEPAEVVGLLRRAGQRGCAPALRELGRMLEAEEGVSADLLADLDEAAAAYARASALGDDEAERLLRRLRARLDQDDTGGANPSSAATG